MMETQLAEFLKRRRDLKICLIYDGAIEVDLSHSSVRRASTDTFEILFSKPPSIADELVIAEARRRSKNQPILVVSSDRKDIVKELEGSSIRTMSSEEFVTYLEETILGGGRSAFSMGTVGVSGKDHFQIEDETEDEEVSTTAEKPDELDPDEIEEWTQVFSDEPQAPTPKDPFEIFEEAMEAEEVEEDQGSPERPKNIEPKLDKREVDKWMDLFSEPLEDE